MNKLNLNKFTRHTSLSLNSICLIFGSLLGKMSIIKNNNFDNYYFILNHSSNRSKYIFWKLSFLSEIQFQRKDSKNKNLLTFISNLDEKLYYIYNLVHRKHMRVNRKWLNLLNSFSIAVWWCDSGKIISNGRSAVICTDKYNFLEVDLICKYFNNYLKIKVDKYTTNNNKIRIRIVNIKDFMKFILFKNPCDFLIRNFTKLIDDNNNTKRWISY